MSDQWEFYFCAFDNVPASVFVDIGIFDSTPDTARPHRVTVRSFLQDPTDEGMTTNEEADRLWKLEDAMTKALTGATDATLVGRTTYGGKREFSFYCTEPDTVMDILRESLSGEDPSTFELSTEHDPEWVDYLDTLYPSPADWQQIFDRQLVEQLIEAGDPLTTAREVAHYLYFNSTDGREQFVETVTSLGFQITDRGEPSDQDHPYGLRITRQDPVVMDHIHTVTRDLLAHAAPNGGIYDGWECEVAAPEVS